MADWRGLAFFAVKRVLYLVLTIFIIISLAFLIFRVAPDDVTNAYIPRGIPVEHEMELIEKLHLDEPIYMQYFYYVSERLTGNFDYPPSTLASWPPLNDFVYDSMLRTVFLLALVVSLSVLFGTLYGLLAARTRRSSVVEALASLPPLVVFSTPVVCTSIISLYLNRWADWLFPMHGAYGLDFDDLSLYGKVIDILYHAFLPVLLGFIASVGFFALMVKDGIRRFVGDGDKAAAHRTQMTGATLLVHSLYGVLPLVKLFVVWSLTAVFLVDMIFEYGGLGDLIRAAMHRRDLVLLDVTFYLGAVTAVAFMLLFDIPMTLLHRRLEKKGMDSASPVCSPEPLPRAPSDKAGVVESLTQGLRRNWVFMAAVIAFSFLVVLAIVGPLITDIPQPSRTDPYPDPYEMFVRGARIPVIEILLFCILSGAVGLSLGVLTMKARKADLILGRLLNRGLEVFGDAMIAISIVPLTLALLFLQVGDSLGTVGLIPFFVFLWYWAPVANTARYTGASPAPDSGVSWDRVASRTLFATKYVAVVGLLSAILAEFIVGGGPDWESWGKMIYYAYSWNLWEFDTWAHILLPALGLALLASSVYVIIGEIERIFNARAKT